METTISKLKDSGKQIELRNKWERKSDQIIRAFHDADKHPLEAARKIANILKSYVSTPLLDDC